MIITITVAGTIALQYLPHLMICPDFAAVATPTTFAEAPISVPFPPKQAPSDNAGKNRDFNTRSGCCQVGNNRDHCCCKRDIINKCTCYSRYPDDDSDHQIQVTTADLTDQVS